MWLSPVEINELDIELPNGEVKTERKDQATLIAELISRVTSLEDTVESILEQLKINTTENKENDMGVKEYKFPNGKTAIFEVDEYGVGKITLEAMDVLMDLMRVINALDSVTWYNGLAETILKWKDIKPKDTIITCLDDYGYGEIEMTTESWKDIGQLQAIWMICVVLFGDYGSSPRYGFIYEKNIKEFHDFIDAITETQRIEYGELYGKV